MIEYQADLDELAPAGYYIALRVGFAFPLEERNALPPDWVDFYTRQRFMMHDPVIRWIYANVGAIRWSGIDIEDPKHVIGLGRDYGLKYGAAISCFDENSDGQRSFGTFARADREYTDAEIERLTQLVTILHEDRAPPTNLTEAELEALRLVKDGMRLKQMAFELGVSEGAIKQRLKNAKLKLRATTGAQAVTRASDFGLI
ncbi:LuxR family transcriptional regulator [Ponticoccus sp. SC2-23]|uniref:helix-turn-helix transcriptional regulator n=1 Tax=Alexandriicola marinus TaxID=2081710 RepID=UPI000FD6DD91|nr:LuxR family transcriptional regulator [Alexandriicola marinus]MBM1222367.1 LuxR family transcriptional regulator [Ponticoccus sp. SC6-9]MBM1224480.1 LuxR family transcriptional regulator [Ponticoccus sp. SC6-15]MBM1229740.1 LuxR family transcriptional regulator [Ponticoccus sp. SC6-38]MBM1233446.1 LuxR family transcriptional regulator [Ponticoccus sp. SC6-45]MBM1236604.1 LuxR family transcriptional regulator [Ponticoccus sp. SC6-49]MBM1244648.1 LuxR family transcriptional regulator [Pontic